jgi:hypothetical protein
MDPGYVRPLVEAVRDSALIPHSMAAAAGFEAKDRRIATTLYASYFDFATPDPALDAMERMLDSDDGLYSLWRVWEPQATQIHNHPRFKRLAARMGLIDYWRENGWPYLCRPDGDVFACR